MVGVAARNNILRQRLRGHSGLVILPDLMRPCEQIHKADRSARNSTLGLPDDQ